MPVATIHLISLTGSTTVPSFLSALHASPLRPLVVSKVVRWIITPTEIDAHALLHPPKPWDLLLIVVGDDRNVPSPLSALVECHWSCTAGIPSRLTNDFASKNHQLLHPRPDAVPPLTGSLDRPRLASSSQTLELSAALATWIDGFAQSRAGQSPLSMLNLLAFKPGMKASYLRYGAAFAESIGSRRGGHAKLVGNILSQNETQAQARLGTSAGEAKKWDEFALASYPSVRHFADMLAGQDYQAVNLESRVPALADTLILCTSEIEIEDILGGNEDLGVGAGRRATMGKL